MPYSAIWARCAVLATALIAGCYGARHAGYVAVYDGFHLSGDSSKEFHSLTTGTLRTDAIVGDIVFSYDGAMYQLRTIDEAFAATNADATEMEFNQGKFNRYLLPCGTFYFHDGGLKKATLQRTRLKREGDNDWIQLPASSQEIEKVFGKPKTYSKTYNTLP